MEKPSVTESMVSKKVKLQESGQIDSARRQGWGNPQAQRQQQQTSHTQPSLTVTAPKEVIKSSSIRVTPPHSPKSGKSRVSGATGSTFQERRSDHRQQSRLSKSVLYGLRLLILGVGIGAIAGTLLSILNPISRITGLSSQIGVQKTQQKPVSNEVVHDGLKLSQEIMPLKTALQQLAAKNAGLIPGVFFVDPNSGAYVELNGTSTFAAASMIKFPVLVAFFQDVDAGKIRLDELLTLNQEMIGGGSGDLQYQHPGTKFTALQTATKMITISDNTATNMLIARLGGAAALNQRFWGWGLTVTQIRNPLPDLSGTNTTSPRDLANLMALVNQGDLMSPRAHDRLLDIMRHTTIDTLLPRGLGQGATIAHKTGDIGSLVGDVGLVDMPSGKRYIAVAMVKRPHNDSRAQELIRQVSRATYQVFNQPVASSSTPATIPGVVTQVGGVTIVSPPNKSLAAPNAVALPPDSLKNQ